MSAKRGRNAAPAANAIRDAPMVATLEPPNKKRGKASSAASEIAAANAAAAKRAAIAEAMRSAQSVPPEVREMLLSTLLGSCCTTGQFHPFQEKILRMLNQTLQDIHADKTCKFQQAADLLRHAKEALQRSAKDHENASSTAAASSAATTRKEIGLAESSVAVQPCKLAVEVAQSDLQRIDSVIGAAAMEIEQLRLARAQIGKVSNEIVVASLEDLHSGWAIAPEKTENLEGELCQRQAALSEIISKSAMSRVALIQTLVVAQDRLDGANETRQSCVAALGRSQSEQHECVAILKAKSQALKQNKAVVAQAVRGWNTAQENLSNFQKGARDAFKDIVGEIEQRNGIHLFDIADVTTTGEAPIASDVATAHQPNQNIDRDLSRTVPVGTPVINRRHRQAVLRRRSAALPMNCFTRLSSMSRQSISAGEAPGASDVATSNPLNGNIDKDLLETIPTGTPVINRQHRQAVLRRRSAVLPMHCFSRLSLMARQSITAAKRRFSETSNGSEMDSASEPNLKNMEPMDQESQVPNVASHVPTPNRRPSVAEVP